MAHHWSGTNLTLIQPTVTVLGGQGELESVREVPQEVVPVLALSVGGSPLTAPCVLHGTSRQKYRCTWVTTAAVQSAVYFG